MTDPNALIGRLSWDACDTCKHSYYHDDYHEGCLLESKYHGTWPITNDGDYVYCDLYERIVNAALVAEGTLEPDHDAIRACLENSQSRED